MSQRPLFDPSYSRWNQEALKGLQQGLAAEDTPRAWQLSTFSGRFAEISGAQTGACLTLVFRLVHEAQKRGEPVAWISGRKSSFFPPDAADSGIDLSALPVIWAPGTMAAARAGDTLLRSGAFAILVMDLGENARLPTHAQTRLTALAKKHDTALLCITQKEQDQPSLGSLISIRAHTERTYQGKGLFKCEALAIKDKQRGPGWRHTEVFHGSDGLY
jgi:recombination protein RecA